MRIVHILRRALVVLKLYRSRADLRISNILGPNNLITFKTFLVARTNFQSGREEIYVRGKPVSSEIGKALANVFWALIAMMDIIEKLAKDAGPSEQIARANY